MIKTINYTVGKFTFDVKIVRRVKKPTIYTVAVNTREVKEFTSMRKLKDYLYHSLEIASNHSPENATTIAYQGAFNKPVI